VGLDLAQECGFRAGNLDVRGLSVRTRRDDHGDVRKALIAVLAAALAALACVSVWPKFDQPVHWTLDGLFYEARMLEIRGESHNAAFQKAFEGPISAQLRREDPQHTGDARWVKYNEPFYERRVAVPFAASVAYPLAGDRSLLYVSLAGYIVSIVALFALLLIRFNIAIAAAVAAAAVFLPPLTRHSSYPITDSWGLALEIFALCAAILTLKRGLLWVPIWIATIGLLGFTRDNAWILVAAVGYCVLRYRSRETLWLFATGLIAALPPLLIFTVPVRDLLAMLVNHFQVSNDTSWSFIATHYPHAVLDLVRANVGFLRRGEWYTALYLVGGVVSLFVVVWKRRIKDPTMSLMTAGAVLSLGYILAAPAFSAFRLELVFLPMAAYGVASVAELLAAKVRARETVENGVARVPAWARRS
jgi:hypothetical protein